MYGAMVHLLSINSSLECVGPPGRHGRSQTCNFFANSRIKLFFVSLHESAIYVESVAMSKMTWIPVLALLQARKNNIVQKLQASSDFDQRGIPGDVSLL
jgi:hypothetical protein